MVERMKAPWHLWLVGVLSLLWSGVGAFDFIQTTTRGEAYMRQSGFGDDMIAYFNAMPDWMYAPWTMGVWGAVLGSILLLARSRWALHALLISLAGAVISLLYQKVINPPPPPPPALAMTAWMPYVIALIAAALALYAWRLGKKGVLR